MRPWREQNVEETGTEIWQFGNDAETSSPSMMLSMPKLPGSKPMIRKVEPEAGGASNARPNLSAQRNGPTLS